MAAFHHGYHKYFYDIYIIDGKTSSHFVEKSQNSSSSNRPFIDAHRYNVDMVSRPRSPLDLRTTEAKSCSIDLRHRLLRNMPFFQGLPDPAINWINPLFTEKDYKSGEVICLYGDPAEHLFIIADGVVRLLKQSLSGKEILLNLLRQGEFFGGLSGLGNDVYPETAQAHTSCCILVIDRTAFHTVIERYPSIALNVIDIMAKRLKEANDYVHRLSVMSVDVQIASLMVMLTGKFGKKRQHDVLLQVPLTRDDLAAMTGATTESVSRVMSRMKHEGLIDSGRGWVAIVDQAGLIAIAGEEIEK